MTNRLSSCAAAAHTLNDRTKSVVRRRHQRQRRWRKGDPFNGTKKKNLCERVASSSKICAIHSAPGSEGTGGSFRCFCLLLSLLTKVGRPGGRNSPHTPAKHLKQHRKREDFRPPFSLPYKPQGDKSPGYREDTPAVQCTGRLSFHYNEKRGKSKPIFSQKIADALVQIVKSCTKTAPGRRSGSGLVSQRSGFQSEGPPPKRSSAWNSPSSRGG